MKVTKAKGLNTIWLADVAANHEDDLLDALRLALRMQRAQRQTMHLWPKARRVLRPSCSDFLAEALGQMVLSPFALATFIWGRK